MSRVTKQILSTWKTFKRICTKCIRGSPKAQRPCIGTTAGQHPLRRGYDTNAGQPYALAVQHVTGNAVPGIGDQCRTSPGRVNSRVDISFTTPKRLIRHSDGTQFCHRVAELQPTGVGQIDIPGSKTLCTSVLTRAARVIVTNSRRTEVCILARKTTNGRLR